MEKKLEKKSKPKIKAEVKAVDKKAALGRAKKEAKPIEAVAVLGLHNIGVPKGAHMKKRILGRGPSSGHGKTSTRGSKGQTSRAGRDMYPGFEGGQTPLIRRIPKRGFVNRFKKEFQIVNLESLASIKEKVINVELLWQKGIIRHKELPVKILAEGEFKQAATVQAHAFSKKAEEKINQAGGKFEVLIA